MKFLWFTVQISYTIYKQNVHWKANERFSSLIQIEKVDKKIITLTIYWKELLSWPNSLMVKFITSGSNTSDLCNVKFSWVQITCYCVGMYSSVTCSVCVICTLCVLFIDRNFIIFNVIPSGNKLPRYCNTKILWCWRYKQWSMRST